MNGQEPRRPDASGPATPVGVAAPEPTVEAPPASEPTAHGGEVLPGWYRTAAAISWRFLAVVAAAGAVVYALVHLRVVVLPIIVALLVSTLLLPVVRWLKAHGAPDALAAAGSMLGAFLLIA